MKGDLFHCGSCQLFAPGIRLRTADEEFECACVRNPAAVIEHDLEGGGVDLKIDLFGFPGSECDPFKTAQLEIRDADVRVGDANVHLNDFVACHFAGVRDFDFDPDSLADLLFW